LRGDLSRLRDKEPKADFITLISLICEIYRAYGDELAPVRHTHPNNETKYNTGHTSTVSHTRILNHGASRVTRGTTSAESEFIIVKRPRQSVLEEQSYALTSFITELRIRTHPPLKQHPNIARFRGVRWDFEDEEATTPRPLLLEELAPQGALDQFWKKWKFVKMNFKSKLDMCQDLTDGLVALHQCGVVHGDVKPENLLVFPRQGAKDEFMVKLTDFGHSVFEHNCLNALPAFTPQWCAPEADVATNMSFSDMKATDCYSYGLVVLSIMMSRPFYTDLEGVEACKKDDTMFRKAVELVEKEDRDNNDSDLDVGVVQSLLSRTIRLNSKRRDLKHCINVINRSVHSFPFAT
jgi:serine/threonine protein kinase